MRGRRLPDVICHCLGRVVRLWCKWVGPISCGPLVGFWGGAVARFLGLEDLFRGRHFDREVIVLCVRWY